MARLIGELQDLKRITSANFEGSFAGWRFAHSIRSYAAIDQIDAADAVEQLALGELAIAIIATRSSALDVASLVKLGLPLRTAVASLAPSLNEHSTALPSATIAALRRRLAEMREADFSGDSTKMRIGTGDGLAEVIRRLKAEPRSGATAVGRSRVLVTPTESHADHCYITAIIAAVLAADQAVAIGPAFVIGLLHHAHNAYLPDGGYGGEMLLGEHLAGVLTAARERVIAAMGESLREPIESAADAMTHLETPLSRIVNAADAIDRVSQAKYHQQVAQFDAAAVCQDLDLVHAGPLQSFQQSILQSLGLQSSPGPQPLAIE